MIEGDIDARIRRLRENDKSHGIVSSDEVYYECLIRANFDQNTALEILRHNRPNLVRLIYFFLKNNFCWFDRNHLPNQ